MNKAQAYPLYLQVKEEILAKIDSNIFKEHEAISSEFELVEKYKVSRITIRRAIQELVREGHLVTKQGLGTFVTQPKIVQNLNTISSWAETMESRRIKTYTKNLLIKEEVAPARIAKLLNIDTNGTVYRMERLRHASGEPICIMVNYLLPSIAPGIIEEKLIDDSLYATLENRYNVKLWRAEETVEAKAAKTKEHELLGVRRGVPLLQVTRITYDENDTPFEVVIATSRADKYAYTVNLVGRPKK